MDSFRLTKKKLVYQVQAFIFLEKMETKPKSRTIHEEEKYLNKLTV